MEEKVAFPAILDIFCETPEHMHLLPWCDKSHFPLCGIRRVRNARLYATIAESIEQLLTAYSHIYQNTYPMGHWNRIFFILMKFSPVAALTILILTKITSKWLYFHFSGSFLPLDVHSDWIYAQFCLTFHCSVLFWLFLNLSWLIHGIYFPQIIRVLAQWQSCNCYIAGELALRVRVSYGRNWQQKNHHEAQTYIYIMCTILWNVL